MMKSIRGLLEQSAALKQRLCQDDEVISQIESGAKLILGAIQNGGTIYTCGNGGSACDAMHFAEELVARYKRERQGIKAMHLLDAGTVTCWANDYDFAGVFERQVSTFCGRNDVLVLFSTSGNSENILRAIKAAKSAGSKTVGLLGKGGGKAAAAVDCPIIIPSQETERIQEAHITIVHIFLELIETAAGDGSSSRARKQP